MTIQAYAQQGPKHIPESTVSEPELIASSSIGDPEGASTMGAGEEVVEADWPTLAVLSRRYVDRALLHTSGNKTRAADLLGIDRRTLNRIVARERARRSKPAT